MLDTKHSKLYLTEILEIAIKKYDCICLCGYNSRAVQGEVGSCIPSTVQRTSYIVHTGD